MNNFTTNTYEMKREILNFSKKISKGLNKPTEKFVLDMEYGIAKSQSILISDIARSLDEKIKLKNTIERLCDNLINLTEKETQIIEKNYLNKVQKQLPEEPIVLFDDSDITKEYGRKFEDLDRVIDASSKDKKISNGYHVCEAVALTKKELQPISIYSKIYSCQSKDFISKNSYTKESIVRAGEIINRKSNYIFDRGYDDNKIIDYVDKSGNYFVIRIEDRRQEKEMWRSCSQKKRKDKNDINF